MSQPAYFNDGRTAERHTVSCAVGNRALAIVDKTGTVLDRWPLDEIRFAGDTTHFRRVGAEARLTLLTDDDGAWLIEHCPNLRKGDRADRPWRTWAVATAFAVLSVIGIFTFLIPSFAGAVVGLVPHSFEQRLGAQSRDQILGVLERFGDGSTPRVCRVPDAQAVLNRRANQIATVLDSPFPVTVTVVRLPITNAFALPGGQVVILSGLLDDAQSGDEVIGVLAHEIAHVVRRDALTVSLQQTGTALLVSLLIGDVFGGAVLSGAASTILESGYSREAEAASDAMAVSALNQLGLTARPLAAFLQRLTADAGLAEAIPDFMQSHPDGDARADEIIAASTGSGRAMTSIEWRTVQRMCR